MNRRELLSRLGVAGTAFTVGGAAAVAGHGSATEGHSGGPLSQGHAHFCGIHVAKSDSKFQLIVQHYCAAHTGESEDDQLFQCILFETAKTNAKLLGIEYIISDKKYRALPEAEKKFWHSHTYEVLAGGLIAPGMSSQEEKNFMKGILTTWGKTWHTWPDPKTNVPLGEPLLVWSLTGDDQADEAVVAARDKEFGVSTAKIREQRIADIGLEVPQVPFASSMNALGRQWTAEGDDVPTKR
jgi:hypothetical protein